MFVLKLPLFFPRLYGEGKRAAISKLTYIWTPSSGSYIIFALVLFLQALEFENFTSKGHFTALKLKNIKLSRFAHPQTTLEIQ